MIVLDTNVVSEAMKPAPDVTVIAWLNDLAAGSRKNKRDLSLSGLLESFENRTLPFETDAARHYSDLAEAAKQSGRGFPTPDGYIAAIVAWRCFIVAT